MRTARASVGRVVCILALAQAAVGTIAWGQTTINGGDVSGIWTVAGSPYQIGGDIIIPADSVLVIEPGVTVEFQGHYELLVNGSLRAIGTETDTILFTISDTTGWADPDTTLGGWKHIRLFETASSNDSTILDYCRIQYGKAIAPSWPFNHGGAISVTGFSKVRISRCLIIHNMSGGPSESGPAGGGIGVTYCDIAIVGNTIASNRSHSGGGVHLSHSNSALQENTITDNFAIGDGGGVEILGDISGATVVRFAGDTIANNTAGPGRGGIGVFDVDSLVLVGVFLRGNSAGWGGGLGGAGAGLFLENCVVEENNALWLGGGVAADYCTLYIQGTVFARNRSQDGAGGMHNDHCETSLLNTSFLQNLSGNDTLAGPAGAINAFASVLDVRECEFAGNRTNGNGGAINADSVSLTLTGSEITGNIARYAGGGIHAYRSTLEIRSSSIRQNTVGNDSIGGLGGGVRSSEGALTLRGCQIDSNLATGSGGGIALFRDNLLLAGSAVSRNRAIWSGGGLDATEGSLNLEDSEVIGNVAGNDTIWGLGGGLRTADGSLLLRNCQVDSNRATGAGGGMATTGDDCTGDGTSFSGNHSMGGGGGIVAGSGTLLLANADLIGNVAGNDTLGANGGGMEAAWSDVGLSNCTVSSNAATSGAGLNIYNSDLVVDGGVFQANSARADGGALLYTEDSTHFGRPYDLRIFNSAFEENEALNQTGGVRIVQVNEDTNQVSLTIRDCLFRNNLARAAAALRILGQMRGVRLTSTEFSGNRSANQAAGAGISGAWGRVANCLFWGNVAGSDSVNASGTGLSVVQQARIEVINCTFADNDAAGATALSIRAGAHVRLINSIAWGNTGLPISLVTGGSAEGCRLWITHSLVQFGADSVNIPDSLSLLSWGGGNIEVDPLFADPTNGDFHLTASSPCIGAGVDSIEIDGLWSWAPASDLDGNPRPAPAGTRPDLGAYEDGVTIPVAVEETASNDLPTSYGLYQNYPNPFNPATAIRFDLPEKAQVSLEVFDLLGARVAVLIDGERDAGRWLEIFSDPTLGSGVYIYRLRAGGRLFVKKMLLLR